MTILLDNVDTDVTSDAVDSNGGIAVVNIRANDFGGATVELQIASIEDGLTRFATLAGGSFIADASVKLDYLPNGISIRAKVSGTTGPSDGIFVDILQ